MEKSALELIKRIEQVSPERLEGYIKAFDRMLLYSLATSIIPKEALSKTVNLWEKTIKKSIDIDAQNRTLFLESTLDGRKAKMVGEPDGELLRLKFLETLGVAQDIIQSNLFRDNTEFPPNKDEDENGDEEKFSR
jgi:hypothetical protein